MCTVVKVDQNSQESSSCTSQNNHIVFLSPKFTTFSLELWSLAAITLFKGLETSSADLS